jgi:hypothetical protein
MNDRIRREKWAAAPADVERLLTLDWLRKHLTSDRPAFDNIIVLTWLMDEWGLDWRFPSRACKKVKDEITRVLKPWIEAGILVVDRQGWIRMTGWEANHAS